MFALALVSEFNGNIASLIIQFEVSVSCLGALQGLTTKRCLCITLHTLERVLRHVMFCLLQQPERLVILSDDNKMFVKQTPSRYFTLSIFEDPWNPAQGIED